MMARARRVQAQDTQAALRADVAAMRARLQSVASPKPAARSRAKGVTRSPLVFKSVALRALCTTFGLSAFEGGLLLLCAAVELDSDVSALCAQIDHREPGRASFALASQVLDEPHWSALLPTGPLRYWRLIEVEGRRESSLAQGRLSISERVLHHLAGLPYLDESLHPLLTAVPQPDELWDAHQAIADRMAAHLDTKVDAAFAITGADARARRTVVAQACAQAGARLFAVRADDIPVDAAERDRLARTWMRDALLAPAVLLVDGATGTGLPAFADRLNTALVVSADESVQGIAKALIGLHLPSPAARERRVWWQAALGRNAARHNGTVDALSSQFALNPGQIAAAVAGAVGDTPEALWDASRLQARPALGDLAQRIEPSAAWNDLVLPPAQMNVLRQVSVHVKQRLKVYDDWGFGAATTTRGLGISALFAGVSGTGKTLAAEVLATELRLDLYRIDLSQVVSKYIGETEKNLRRVFDAAEGGGVILLFDEADALFGRRSEVKDSHDRYANIEVSYLLQRMEAYRGLAILTTNQRGALDQAFLRRLRFIVEFPFPDASGRAEIWRRAFPAAAPTEGLDVSKLARLNVAGGNIRNIAVNAAFLAADAGRSVTPADVLSAARSEYSKMDKALTDAEVRDWV